MRKQLKPLKQVTDRFSLFEDGRTLDANKRNYIIKSVQDTIASAKTQELLRLKESFGYYGHAPRQRANKLDIGETEVIMIKGRPVVVENVPAARTIAISCSDDGIVTHTQEFLDSPTGKIALSLWESGAGGWSWATGGDDRAKGAIARAYHGMDYVLQPNYISLDHPAMMMESAGAEKMFLESLQSKGFDANEAESIADHIRSAVPAYDAVEHEQQIMFLEGINADLNIQLEARNQQVDMLLEAVNKLPIYISDAQRIAMNDIGGSGNLEVVQAMFESVGSSQAKTLPIGFVPVSNVVEQKSNRSDLKDHIVNFGDPSRRFTDQ